MRPHNEKCYRKPQPERPFKYKPKHHNVTDQFWETLAELSVTGIESESTPKARRQLWKDATR